MLFEILVSGFAVYGFFSICFQAYDYFSISRYERTRKKRLKKWEENPEMTHLDKVMESINGCDDPNMVNGRIKKPFLGREIFGGTVLWWINFLIVQWLFTRLTHTGQYRHIRLMRLVLPLTGWWSNYIFIIPRKVKVIHK
jgi:hypothetical protein